MKRLTLGIIALAGGILVTVLAVRNSRQVEEGVPAAPKAPLPNVLPLPTVQNEQEAPSSQEEFRSDQPFTEDAPLIDDIAAVFSEDLKAWERESIVVLEGIQPHLNSTEADSLFMVIPPVSNELHERLDALLRESGVKQIASAKTTILQRLGAGQTYRYLGFEANRSGTDRDLVMVFEASDMNAVQIDPVSGAVSFLSDSISIDPLSDSKIGERYSHLYEITEEETETSPAKGKYFLEFDDSGLLPSSKEEWDG